MKTAPSAELLAAAGADWPDTLVDVGHVLDAWGTRGWIKLAPASAQAAALLACKRLWLSAPPPSRTRLALDVRLARHHGSAVVALLDGVTTRDDAESLRGWRVHARREDFPPPAAGEYYWVDLIGCQVVDRDGAALGVVEGLLDSGAQAILQLRVDGRRQPRLIPFVDAYVIDVDLDARRIVADWQADFD